MRWWHRGYGWGFRGFRGYGAPWCPWSFWGRRWWRGRLYPYYGITKDEEKEILEVWKNDLEAELEEIKKRLEELK